MTDHAFKEILARAQDRRAQGFCVCGWPSGFRRTRSVAREAVEAHVERETAREVGRAHAILYDHAMALHEDYYDDTIGCTWPGCEEARFLVDTLNEADR